MRRRVPASVRTRYRAPMSDLPEPTIDPISARVARNRWFWLLVFRDGPDRSHDDEAADRIQREHLAYLFSLEANGQVTAFGPVLGLGDIRGIGVMTVPTRAEAEALIAQDPAVRSGRLSLEIRPWFTLPGSTLPAEGATSPAG